MWTVHLPSRVSREVEDVPPSLQAAILKALQGLRSAPRPVGCKKLRGRLQAWRIRVGPYRILYDVDDRRRIVTLLKIGLRKDVYRWL